MKQMRLMRVAAAGLAVAAIAVGAAAAAVQPPKIDNASLAKLGGSITVDGSSTVGPYAVAAAELFRKAGAANVQVTVGISGTGGGFERFCKGETDLSNASRPMKNKEAAACKQNAVGAWRAFTVANDALTAVVNHSNTWATCLTVAELKKIWDSGSKISSWKDVRAGFPDEPLRLFGPGTDSGTFDYFTEVINGKAKRSRSDFSASEDDNVLVQGVSGTKGGLGYFGYSYYVENQSTLKALQIENPKTGKCVAPSVASAQDGSYRPLSRPLFIYAKGSSFRRPEVQAFFEYLFTNEKQIAERSRFVPLTEPQLKRARSNYRLALVSAAKG